MRHWISGFVFSRVIAYVCFAAVMLTGVLPLGHTVTQPPVPSKKEPTPLSGQVETAAPLPRQPMKNLMIQGRPQTGMVSSGFSLPFSPVNGRLTSHFGWRTDPYTGKKRFHHGIDIGAPGGTPIFVPQDGIVAFSGKYKGYGNLVVIFHPPNLYTLYGHTQNYFVKRGQQVKAGSLIAMVGSTGRSTGPHLHFEVRQNKGWVNPMDYLSYLSAVRQNPYVANYQYHGVPFPNQSFQQVGGPEHQLSAPGRAHRPTHRQNYQSKNMVEVIRGTQVDRVYFDR